MTSTIDPKKNFSERIYVCASRSGDNPAADEELVRQARFILALADEGTADEIDYYTDNADEWRWRLKGDNGEIFAAAHEGFSDKSGARDNAKREAVAMTQLLIAGKL